MLHAFSRFWKSLNREQRLSVGLLSVCSFVAITFGIIQIRRNIIYPFTAPVDRLVTFKKLFGPTDAEKEAQAKKADTDGDGLSDWDEENLYRTSMYLADTDSDGVPDNTEIARRTDPNCPEGQGCGYVYEPPAAAGFSAQIGGAASSSTQDYGKALPLVPERNIASIRSYLKAQGISDAQLEGYSDDQLLQAYDRSMVDFQSAVPTSTSASKSSVSASSTSATTESAKPIDTTLIETQ